MPLKTKLTHYSSHNPDEIQLVNSENLDSNNIDQFLNTLHYLDLRNVHKETFKQLIDVQINEGCKKFINYHEEISNLKSNKTKCLIDIGSHYKLRKMNTKGIAEKFSRLKRESDIVEFAKEYGLLRVLSSSTFGIYDYSFTVFEPLSIWKAHIENVTRLLKLYRVLSKKHQGEKMDIIGDLIRCEDNVHFYTFYWIENQSDQNGELISTGPVFMNPNETFDEDVGILILTHCLKESLSGGINLSYSDIKPSKKSNFGFSILEARSTNCLLAAIYYDLWELITENKNIRLCDFIPCSKPFTESGRKKYCSDSCKTMKHNQLKAFRMFKNGLTTKKIADELKLGKNQIEEWIKNKRED